MLAYRNDNLLIVFYIIIISTLLSIDVPTRMGVVITMPSPVFTISQLEVLMKLTTVKSSQVACYVDMEESSDILKILLSPISGTGCSYMYTKHLANTFCFGWIWPNSENNVPVQF
jgi:hypothetical protein